MPKTKKKEESSSDSDSGPDDRNQPASKKSKSDNSKSDSKSKSGTENEWSLGKNKMVKINEFRGTKYIDIREYYEKDGKTLPGKKGIMLNLQQFEKILESGKDIIAAVKD